MKETIIEKGIPVPRKWKRTIRYEHLFEKMVPGDSFVLSHNNNPNGLHARVYGQFMAWCKKNGRKLKLVARRDGMSDMRFWMTEDTK